MEIFEPLTSLLYNIGSASQGSGPSSWLPEIFGGGVSSMGDVFKNAVKTKIQENQQNADAEQRLQNRSNDLP